MRISSNLNLAKLSLIQIDAVGSNKLMIKTSRSHKLGMSSTLHHDSILHT